MSVNSFSLTMLFKYFDVIKGYFKKMKKTQPWVILSIEDKEEIGHYTITLVE